MGNGNGIKPADVLLYRSSVPTVLKHAQTFLYTLAVVTIAIWQCWDALDGRVEAADRKAGEAIERGNQAKETARRNGARIDGLSRRLYEVEKDQGIILNRLDNAEEAQKEFRDRTDRSLQRILRKLDQHR